MTLTDDDLQFISAVVLHAARRLPPQFDRDDLLQAGRLAALQAALAYQPHLSNGATFRTFARYRIRGAVLMAARRRNWTEAWHLPLQSDGEAVETLAYVDHHAGPLEQLHTSDLGREILDAIEMLRNPERWVFTRRQLDGAAPWRIAKQAHWPIMRVLAVERSAQAWLRSELERRGITPATSCLA